MVKRFSRKYQTDWDAPLTVEILTTAGPQPWHNDALLARYELELTVRQCAKLCGVGFGPMQRFLNPESKRKQKQQQNKRDRDRRANDYEYALKSRTYRRKYMQTLAPGKMKD